ncbi:DUF4197 domain-containing protein [Fulvivirga kasyanovii]|uniref:DUF4197 domain-containing protein n=2 Tax=Fulvivirga kasyanovii TaxID=396812 RepID=A0ABW9RM71_9BACT|nr:DUF4197 domain-containing protein [Fulvivirga kasyanovii]MTI24453.1 DUF4197 domain-containing protein [Fulvivirga kasyanovii]
MKKLTILTVLIAMLAACTSSQINKTIGDINKALGEESLSTEQVVAGLKEALIKGITTGSAEASKIDGYFKNPKIKIPFPPDVQRVEEKLRQIGLGNEVDKFVMTLNRGAEDAAKEAKPIFINAIKSMTIQDAWGILKGDDNAATQYLIKTTSVQLKSKFKPVIKNSLDKVNATKYYGDIVTTYNKIPFVDKVNPDLDDYATDKAIEGLFYLVAQEEEKIRKDPVARTTELLKKVFAAQDQ